MSPDPAQAPPQSPASGANQPPAAQPQGTAPEAEQRPDYIAEGEWKGSTKATLEAMRSQAHFAQLGAKAASLKDDEIFSDKGMDALNEDLIRNNGKLSDAFRERLKKAKIPDSLIDSHINGLSATLEVNTMLAMNELGGEERFKHAIEHVNAIENPAERGIFERGLKSRDREVVKATAKILSERIERLEGAQVKEPKLASGGSSGAGAGGVKPVRSKAEKQALFGDRRYYMDGDIGKEFRDMVEKRLAQSLRMGIVLD